MDSLNVSVLSHLCILSRMLSLPAHTRACMHFFFWLFLKVSFIYHYASTLNISAGISQGHGFFYKLNILMPKKFYHLNKSYLTHCLYSNFLDSSNNAHWIPIQDDVKHLLVKSFVSYNLNQSPHNFVLPATDIQKIQVLSITECSTI